MLKHMQEFDLQILELPIPDLYKVKHLKYVLHF